MILIWLLIAMIVPGWSYARELTLDQALQLARAHSWQLKKAQAETQSSIESLAAARAERFPTLTAAATASFVDDIPQLELAVPGLGSINRDLGSTESYQTDLRLTIPLYTGGRIKAAVRLAAAGRDYREALELAHLDQLYYQTRLDYFGLYRSAKLREAAEASLTRTDIIRQDVLSGFQAGVADSVDLLDADLSRTRALFAAEQASMNVRAANIKLAVRLGLAAGDQLTIADTLPDPTHELELEKPEIMRAELAAADASIGMSRARVTAEKSGLLPSLALFGGYSYGKPNGNFFANEWRDYWTAGANLSWSFNLGLKTTSKTRMAGYDLEAARRQRDDIAETLFREVDLALEQLGLAHSRYLSARREFEITSRNYQLARSRHHNGVLSSNRLLEIETALAQAESSLAAAKVDYYIAQSAYWYAFGSDQLGKGL